MTPTPDESELRRLREKSGFPAGRVFEQNEFTSRAPWRAAPAAYFTALANNAIPLLDQKNAELANYKKMLAVVWELCEYDLSNREMRQRLNQALNDLGLDNEPEPIV